MPKVKTNKSAAKRLTVTGSGRIKHARTNRRHLLTAKSQDRKRRLRASVVVNAGDRLSAKRLLGLA